jgi:hypothetical protein
MNLPAGHQSPTVFISYSHDSDTHKNHVLALADRLRTDGLDVIMDQYVIAPAEGWPRWMDRQIRDAAFVLLICTATYLSRINDQVESGTGRGALWEGHLIYQHLYNARAVNLKFIPVLLGESSDADIPFPLQSVPAYRADTESGYEELYRRVTNQPGAVKPELGQLRSLPFRNPSIPAMAGSSPGTPHPGRRYSSRRALVASLSAAAILCVGVYLWRHEDAQYKPTVYRVRVLVLNSEGVPVNNATVTSSTGGEPMKVEGGWLFVIPMENVPRNRTLTVYADLPSAYLHGAQDVLLGADQTVTAKVHLEMRASAQIRGTVWDESSRAVSGARVSVDGYGQEAVTTGPDGNFVLPAHKANGQDVLLHVDRTGYKPLHLLCQAGNAPVTLTLER